MQKQKRKRKMAGIISYMPGYEPDSIRKELDELFRMIDEEFPDKHIDPLRWNHKQWDSLANHLISVLGYSKGFYFLNAYGYTMDEAALEAVRMKQAEQNNPQRFSGKIIKVLKYGKSGFIRSDDDEKDYYFNVRDFLTKEKILEIGRPVAFSREVRHDFKSGEDDVCAVKIEYIKNKSK